MDQASPGQLGVLGPLEIRDPAGGRLVPRRRKERLLLALLLLRANSVISTDLLSECLWQAAPPRSAAANLRAYILDLRRLLRASGTGPLIETRANGYVLVTDPDQVDVLLFERLADEGRLALVHGEHRRAAGDLRRAVSLWRGPVMEGLPVPEPVQPDVLRLEDKHLAAIEDGVEARLALGEHVDLAGELAALTAQHEFRERLWGAWMLALYRSGRQADALAAYQKVHRLLDGKLGVAPGLALRELHQQILRSDPLLDLSQVGIARVRPDVPPRQLPLSPADFTGRSDQLSQLDLLVGRAGAGSPGATLAVIDGPGGVGKTATAVRWGHQVVDQFPDGQLYADLRGYAHGEPARPLDVLGVFIRALGLPAELIPGNLDEASNAYRSLLADKRVLIVLDNARSAEQVRPLLPGSAGCVVLVTSRDRLSGLLAAEGAHRVTLEVLTATEAVELLNRVVGRTRIAAEPEAAGTLAAMCGHLPLALRVAGANLAGRPHETISGYLEELGEDHRLRALTIDGDQGTDLRATFGLSYRSLPRPARRLFRLLGLIPGPDFTVRSAAALADSTVVPTGRQLGALADAHLIEHRAGGRFAMHDLIRLYAQAKARGIPTSDRNAAVRRLFEGYLHDLYAAGDLVNPGLVRLPSSASSGPKPPIEFETGGDALAWLDAESPNLLATVRHCAEHGPHELAWRICDALAGYIWLRYNLDSWLAAAAAATAAATATGDAAARMATRHVLGDAHGRRADFRTAIAHYETALAVAGDVDWPERRAAILASRGAAHFHLGDLRGAYRYLVQAKSIKEKGDPPANLAIIFRILGRVHQQLGELSKALEHHTRALALSRATRDNTLHGPYDLAGEAYDLTDVGITQHKLGRLDDAMTSLLEAAARHRKVDNRTGESFALSELAAVLGERGQLGQARTYALGALDIARETTESRAHVAALIALAGIQLLSGEHREAADGFERAVQLTRAKELLYREVTAMIGLASARIRLGQYEKAGAVALDALRKARRARFRILEQRAVMVLAEIQETPLDT